MTLTVGSLFSGCGCGDLGLEWAGFEHRWFCECDPYARRVLAVRWPGVPVYGDIREVDFSEVPPVDLLAGGFPCQDISLAGLGAGIGGERSGLWTEFARAIGDIRPRYVLIENSPALVTRGLDRVLSDIAALRYDAEWICFPASALGAPHKRDRIWIMAYPDSLGEPQPQRERNQIGRRSRNSGESHAMADPARIQSDGQQHVEHPQPGGRSGQIEQTGGAGGDVSDSDRMGCDEKSVSKNGQILPDKIGQHPQAERVRNEFEPGVNRGCSGLADSYGTGCEKLDTAPVAVRPGFGAGCAPEGGGGNLVVN